MVESHAERRGAAMAKSKKEEEPGEGRSDEAKESKSSVFNDATAHALANL